MLTARRNGYLLSDDHDRLDVELVHRRLSTDAYWARGRSLDQVRAAVAGSESYGVYREAADPPQPGDTDLQQIAFAPTGSFSRTSAMFMSTAPTAAPGLAAGLSALCAKISPLAA